MGAVGIYTDYQKNKFIQNWDQNDLRYQFGLYKQTQNGTLNALTKTVWSARNSEIRNGQGAVQLPMTTRYIVMLIFCFIMQKLFVAGRSSYR